MMPRMGSQEMKKGESKKWMGNPSYRKERKENPERGTSEEPKKAAEIPRR